jgi:hypothetical protein
MGDKRLKCSSDGSYSFFPEGTNKKDFEEANIGWKIHLNVCPENTKAVSEYLISQEYYHKYFGGGEIEDGKIFTVYIGSYLLTEKLAREIYHDIYWILARSRIPGELEFAP